MRQLILALIFSLSFFAAESQDEKVVLKAINARFKGETLRFDLSISNNSHSAITVLKPNRDFFTHYHLSGNRYRLKRMPYHVISPIVKSCSEESKTSAIAVDLEVDVDVKIRRIPELFTEEAFITVQPGETINLGSLSLRQLCFNQPPQKSFSLQLNYQLTWEAENFFSSIEQEELNQIVRDLDSAKMELEKLAPRVNVDVNLYSTLETMKYYSGYNDKIKTLTPLNLTTEKFSVVVE